MVEVKGLTSIPTESRPNRKAAPDGCCLFNLVELSGIERAAPAALTSTLPVIFLLGAARHNTEILPQYNALEYDDARRQ